MSITETNRAGKTGPKTVHSPRGNSEDSRHYFQKLKKRVMSIMILAFLAPLALLFFYFHFQFNLTMKQSGKVQLLSLAESQRNTIDLFLQERVVNIFNLFQDSDFKINPEQADMDRYLKRLQGASDAFVDVGFLDETGHKIGYSGPFPYLRQKNYKDEHWFITLLSQGSNYFISDIYRGFRDKPHFTIAVKQLMRDHFYIMRATLDPDKFYYFLKTIGQGDHVNSFLVNRAGEYQVVAPGYGEVLQKSAFQPEQTVDADVAEVSREGESELVGYAWLKQVPWALVARQPLKLAYARMFVTRRYIFIGSALTVILLFSAVVITTGRLLNKAEKMEKDRHELKSQLFHAAKLVSVGELAAGVAHEINNPLAIICSQCGVIRDMFDPEFGAHIGPETPAQVNEELAVIDDAVTRAKGITQKLLISARKTTPRITRCNLNQILDDLVGGFLEREFKVSNIQLVRDYEPDLPDIMTDADQLRQVFQNLINNAADAIEGSGTITLSTSADEGFVKASVTDTGRGMTQEVMGRIFMPFFTTKEVGKGTGLGLGISLSIAEAMGGSISVQSMPGAGSTFTVTLPTDSMHEVEPS
jgi:two-component system NtrC family sensor kinase